MTETIEKILDETLPEEKSLTAEEKRSVRKTLKEKDESFLDMTAEELINRPESLQFKKILLRKLEIIKNHKMRDIEQTRKEVEGMNIDISVDMANDTDIELYNRIMEIIQGFRDRIHHILSQAYSDFCVVEEAYNNLYRMWTGKFSRLSSDKRREGEAEYILSELSEKRRERENFYSEIRNASKNLNDKMEVVSRKVTIIQEVHKILGFSTQKDDKDKDKDTSAKRQEYYKNINKKREQLVPKVIGRTMNWTDIVPLPTYDKDEDENQNQNKNDGPDED